MGPDIYSPAGSVSPAAQDPEVKQPDNEAVALCPAHGHSHQYYDVPIRTASPPISDTTLSEISDIDTHINEACHPRSKTVRNLANLLNESKTVLVCGPPMSGKTTLARLLEEFYRKLGCLVLYMEEWKDKRSDPVRYLCDSYNEQDDEFKMRYKTFSESPVVVLIDNAEKTYSSSDFWLKFIRPLNAERPELRICLFASYGHPVTGIDAYRLGKRVQAKVARFEPLQRVSAIRPCFAEDEHPQLYYDREEFEDIVSNLCLTRGADQLQLTPDASNYLYSLTRGHPGATDAILAWIFKLELTGRPNCQIPIIKSRVTMESLVDVLRFESELFDFLKGHPIQRSFADGDNAKIPHVRGALRNFRYRHSLELSVPAGRFCYQQGWIYPEAADKDGRKLAWRFPSKLHDKYVEFKRFDFRVKHNTTFGRHFGFNKYPSLPALCKDVLDHLTASDIIWYKEADAYGNVRSPVEMFKLHFYANLTQEGVEIPVTTKWSETLEPHQFDFIVRERSWGIHLLFYSEDSDETPLGIQARIDRKHPFVKESLLLIFSMSDTTHLTKSLTTEQKAAVWHIVLRPDFLLKDVCDAHGQDIFLS